MIVYGGIKINMMLTHGADADMSLVQIIDPNDLGQVDINSTGMLFFLQLQQNHFNLTFTNLSRYVDIFFSQRHDDNLNTSNSFKQRFEVKICTQDDFG